MAIERIRLRLEPGNVFTVLLGLCFVAAGLYIYIHMGRFLETAQAASGVVVEVVHQSEVTKKGRIHPVVRFTTKDGKEVVIRPQQHYNVQPGQTLQLLYDPANPEQAEVGTLARAQNRRIAFAAGAIVFGVLLCLGGLALDLGLLKRRPTAY